VIVLLILADKNIVCDCQNLVVHSLTNLHAVKRHLFFSSRLLTERRLWYTWYGCFKNLCTPNRPE